MDTWDIIAIYFSVFLNVLLFFVIVFLKFRNEKKLDKAWSEGYIDGADALLNRIETEPGFYQRLNPLKIKNEK